MITDLDISFYTIDSVRWDMFHRTSRFGMFCLNVIFEKCVCLIIDIIYKYDRICWMSLIKYVIPTCSLLSSHWQSTLKDSVPIVSTIS